MAPYCFGYCLVLTLIQLFTFQWLGYGLRGLVVTFSANWVIIGTLFWSFSKLQKTSVCASLRRRFENWTSNPAQYIKWQRFQRIAVGLLILLLLLFIRSFY